jgi:hypothetical protein
MQSRSLSGMKINPQKRAKEQKKKQIKKAGRQDSFFLASCLPHSITP